VTRYRVVDRRKNFTVLEVEPLTGRTNQIRIHLKAIGHPVVGEKRFAFRRDFKLKANRLCLHAKSLEFRHPLADKKIILDSHLPLGMQNFLEKNPE
jgi:23S rRNA-/tRNA-specific pseudouridylate synthase